MNSGYYPKTTNEINVVQLEEEILDFWQQNGTFRSSVDSKNDNDFVFYDGPPFANGLPHYGHLLTGFIKDVFARYHTMLGKRVDRRFGWDCHGLPAEMGAEKKLGISGRAAIEKFGIEKFNNICRNSVMEFTNEWESYVTRQARWVDFKNDYKTMDKSFMESVIWAFKQLYDKGLIYESIRVMPYSWACETPLSNFETKMDNSYRKKTSKAVTVKFELLDILRQFVTKRCQILVWTTTPWTLPSNLALAVGNDVKYGAVILADECYIAALSYLEFIYKGEEILSVSSEDLVGLTYKPLFPYFADNKNSFKLLQADFVVEGDGTGIVHVAPGFGEDDFELCKKYNIQVVCPVDNSGKFTPEVPMFAGMQVFSANDEVIKYLKLQGVWVKTEQYIHNYPHCWRTDTPLIYKAVSSWYVEVTKFKKRMVQLNQGINWIPQHIREGQFGKWLEGARDWSISRNRFWGTPVPVWKSDNPKYPRIDVYGSIDELERDFGVEIKDLHRPFIDSLVRANPDDPSKKSMMRRVEDVLDCWFESGSMPYAQVHYPFANKEWFEKNFPSDFITEYISQTRGWFYTLIVLSTALFDCLPFKNCVCHGVVLDTKGQKLSKRLNNYANPIKLFNKYGSDALRFFMLASPVVHGGDLLLDKEGDMVRDSLRLVIKPIWNAYHFFTLYANADCIRASYNVLSKNVLDQYIIAKCYKSITAMKKAYDSYDTVCACKSIVDFFDVLNNWYIRRSRDRFWQLGISSDRQSAYNTLYSIFNLICRAVAPLLPMLVEKIWLGIGNKDSVHLQDFPKIQKYDDSLIKSMDRVRDICNAALAIRSKKNIRVRQPLQKIIIYGERANSDEDDINLDLIRDEVNVKEIIFKDNITEVAKFKLKINFPILGKRLPVNIKEIIHLVGQESWKCNSDGTLNVGRFVLYVEEFQLLLQSDKDNVRTLSSNAAVVLLDTNISEELAVEGAARDIVRLIQQARKEACVNITDKIHLVLQTEDSEYKRAIIEWESYIKTETLTLSVMIGKIDESCQFKYGKTMKLSIGIMLE